MRWVLPSKGLAIGKGGRQAGEGCSRRTGQPTVYSAIDRSSETSLENRPVDFQHAHDGDLDRSDLGDKNDCRGFRREWEGGDESSE